jgi:hypothetical protein
MIMSNTPLPQAIVDRSANNWADARIVKPFQKFGHVVGLHIERDGQTAALHFSSIEDRLNERRVAIDRELEGLNRWFENLDEYHLETSNDGAYYSQYHDALIFERHRIEQLWQEVRSYMEEEE